MSKPIKKSTRKSAELDQSNLKKIAAAMKTEMTSVDKGDQSMTAAIRKVAHRLASVRRIEIEKVLTDAPFKLNLGTVRRQVQEGRK